MSEFDSNDQGARGYFLPEDGQCRLRKLRAHMQFLSHLAQPRTAGEDADAEAAPGIGAGALAVCLEMLAEQAGRVLDAVSWPARLETRCDVGTHTDGMHDDGRHADGRHDQNADGVVRAEDEAGAAPDPEDPFVFGVTLAQIDALNRLVGILSAHGDMVTAGQGAELAEHTLPVLGEAIFDGAQSVRGILRAVESQHLASGARARIGVREAPGLYVARPMQRLPVHDGGAPGPAPAGWGRPAQGVLAGASACTVGAAARVH